MHSARLALPFRAGVVCALALIAVGLIACGGGDSPPRTNVALTFSDWEIALDPVDVQAGEVTFDLNNTSEVPHNLVIVKSDLPPSELPRTDDGAVDKSKLNLAGGAGPIAPGPPPEDAEGYALELSPGKYVLLCDVIANGESHYANGMYASLLVEP